MPELISKKDISEKVELKEFDIAPEFTRHDGYITTSIMPDKKYPTDYFTNHFFQTFLIDFFSNWYGDAFEGVVSYYDDQKEIHGNTDYFVIRGIIGLIRGIPIPEPKL